MDSEILLSVSGQMHTVCGNISHMNQIHEYVDRYSPINVSHV